MSGYRKKLIEVALPLDAINRESAREKSIRHGHPPTLHLWWARRPLVACRAVLFGQLVDDPSAWPERFPTEADQDQERQRLFRILEELVKWENSNNAVVLDAARLEIARSFARHRQTEGEGDHRDEEVLRQDVSPETVRDYLAEVLPPVHDPFAGGGSIPLEAQRLGLRAIASDLNPVAVMICKALIEIPAKFAERPPVGPLPASERQTRLSTQGWPGATGLAEDVRRYGAWMREEAWKRIGHLYPKVDVTAKMAQDRPELQALVGQKLTVIAWLWARTVSCPNPACGAQMPLARSFWLSTKKGKQAWVEPVVDRQTKGVRFAVRTGVGAPQEGTVSRQGARCIVCAMPVPLGHVRAEGKTGRMHAQLMAIVAEGRGGRIYLPPDEAQTCIAECAQPPDDVPDADLVVNSRYMTPTGYGMTKHCHLFTNRQLVALTTFCDLVGEARAKVLEETGGDQGYADAVTTYLGFAVDKAIDRNTSLCTWEHGMDRMRNTFGRQALSMVWDFAETNPFAGAGGDVVGTVRSLCEVLDALQVNVSGATRQANAATVSNEVPLSIISTDPPYYDNVPYADLSDFFYVWLRRCLRPIYPELFGTLLVPKAEELVADPFRHGGKDQARVFFEQGMSRVFARMREASASQFPATVYYAFKQTEEDEDEASKDARGLVVSTGWETFLQGLIGTGWQIEGTWPVRTELGNRMRSMASNALASSIVLICRKRPEHATTITRGDFRRLLRRELPAALHNLQKGNIAPVDMAQASIGPGMAIFSRHTRVVEADGSAMSVRGALQLINEVVDEVRGEEEADLDRATRFAVTWFESHGFAPGLFGDAETLAKARNVSVTGVEQAGLLKSVAGKVQLLTRAALPEDWNLEADGTLTVWECTQHLIKRLEDGGEAAAATLLAQIGPQADAARRLAYRLYTTCERRGWAEEARAYNGLVIAWPELERLASERDATLTGAARQTTLFNAGRTGEHGP